MSDWFIEHADLAAFALSVGTFVVHLTWSATSLLFREVRFRLSAVTRDVEIRVGPFANTGHLVARMDCLIIRYGNDKYLKGLATEEERWAGRLQNRVIPIPFENRASQLCGVFKLPVHRRLGTQFICAITAKSLKGAKQLVRNKALWAPTADSSQALQRPRREGKRVFVLLHDPEMHPSAKTMRVEDIDGEPVFNSMYYPF